MFIRLQKETVDKEADEALFFTIQKTSLAVQLVFDLLPQGHGKGEQVRIEIGEHELILIIGLERVTKAGGNADSPFFV